MLIKLSQELLANAEIKIEKFRNGENASQAGAFSHGEKLRFAVHVPREFGARGVVLRLQRDGEGDRDMAFDPCGGGDYELEIELSTLGEGLYWYTILFLRGEDTLFASSVDNVSFKLLPREGSRFRLLVYEEDFATPEWFRGGTMYQIFPDRFFRSNKCERRADAENEENWSAPISQFGAVPGADVKNDLFYGGDLYGVCEKLDYLKDLGHCYISEPHIQIIFKP